MSPSAERSLGYDVTEGRGIRRSIAVEFDTWQHPDHEDPAGDHVAIRSNGIRSNTFDSSPARDMAVPEVSFADAQPHVVRVVYDGHQFSVFLDQFDTPLVTTEFDMASELRLCDDAEWIGFTSSTGGAAQTHEILDWSFQTNP
jgi:hypothetical protein